MAPIKHNYCRTCGSRVESNSVCYKCGCPPFKGNNFCFDCGAETLPDAIICVHCHTSLQRKFPVMAAALVVLGIIAASVGAGIFFSKLSNSQEQNKVAAKTDTSPAGNGAAKSSLKKETDLPKSEIVNNPVISTVDSTAINTRMLNARSDSLAKLIQDLETKQKTNEPGKDATSSNVSIGLFTLKELDDYTIDCPFFVNTKDKNSVVFFYTRTLGYAKINGRITEVKLKANDKVNGLMKFSNNRYDVTLAIDGISGSAKEWFASGTLSVVSAQQGLMSQRHIFSSCAMN